MIIVVVILGFFRHWFEISTDTQDERSSLILTVDKERFRTDKDNTVETVQEWIDSFKKGNDTGSRSN